MLTLRLPLQVNHLIDLLSGSGHEAYAVGCCVRDRLVDLIPAEWEVCTDASLAQAASCIQNELHIEPKQEPNSLMLVVDGVSLRVTTATFRQESSSSNPKPDLSDRGLTVNAIAYHPVKGVVNEFHGLEDLEGKLIRGIGDPDIYFRRNPFNMLQTLRFSALSSCRMDRSVASSIHRLAPMLSGIPAERASVDFCRILMCSNAAGTIRNYFDVASALIPSLAAPLEREANLPALVARSLEHCPPDLTVRLALLLLPIERQKGAVTGALAKQAALDFALDSLTAGYIEQLCGAYDTFIPTSPTKMKKMIAQYGKPLFQRLILFKKALIYSGQGSKVDSILSLHRSNLLLGDILRNNQCCTLRELAVGQEDLTAEGLSPEDAKRILPQLLEQVWAQDSLNTREKLLPLAKRLAR